MSTDIEPIVLTERGDESHPSWIVIRANRISSSPPGVRLFDSEINHQHFVRVTVQRCTRNRDLHKDWIFGTQLLMEIDMSMAQWGGFVSSFGDGSGVPVTLSYFNGERVPEAPYESRIAESIKETKDSAARMVEQIREAQAAVDEAFARNAGRKEMRELLADVTRLIEQTPGNVEFASKSLTKHVENTVAKARGDVEAMVAHAAAHGLETGEVNMLSLIEGDPIDVDGTEG